MRWLEGDDDDSGEYGAIYVLRYLTDVDTNQAILNIDGVRFRSTTVATVGLNDLWLT